MTQICIRKTDKALWNTALGTTLLPVVYTDPENAYPAAIARKVSGLQGLAEFCDNQVRLALVTMEEQGLLRSTRVAHKDVFHTKVRLFSLTERGMMHLVALSKGTCNVVLEK